MSAEANKVLVRRMYDEGVNAHNIELFDDLMSDDFVEHEVTPGLEPNRDGVKQFFAMVMSAFPDFRMEVHDMIAEGDRVVARITMSGTHQGEFMGMPASGNRFEAGAIDILRVVDGQVVEHWGVTDTLGMMEQLGG